MPFTLTIVWLVVLTAVALMWLSRHVQISKAGSGHQTLSATSHDGPPEPAPTVSVLVAAKDEEENIEACVESFLEQDYPHYELIVIDDRSSDRTPELLRQLQSRFDGRLQVITVERLREGWFGKNNAMREGVAVAGGEWLCFADADCRQTSRRTLSMAVREAVGDGTDFLSVLPVVETKSFWERIIQPACGAVLIYWFHPDKVNDAESKAAYANGAFMLVRRATYDAIGGHQRVRTQVNEDIHMARFCKEAGHKLRVVLNDGLYVARMYSSMGQIWRGWSRIFYGCLGSFRRLMAALLILLTFSVFPWFSLLAALVGLTVTQGDARDPLWYVLVASTVAVALQQSVMVRFYRLSRFGPKWSALYLLGALICSAMLCNAMLKLGGLTKVTWRGTSYRGRSLDGAGDRKAPEAAVAGAGPTPEEVGAHVP
ncbi:MAG: glycosyltransferase [Phycisphaerae bacterium]